MRARDWCEVHRPEVGYVKVIIISIHLQAAVTAREAKLEQKFQCFEFMENDNL